LVTVVLSSILWLAGAPDAQATPTWCGLGTVQASELPQAVSPGLCDLQGVVVRDGLAGAVVPEPGTAVEAFALRVDGPEDSFAIVTAPDGTVTVLGVDDDPIVAPGSSAADPLFAGSGSPALLATADVDPDVLDPGSGPIQGDECIDDFYRLVHGGEHDTNKWYMHASSIPGYFGVPNDTVIARIREGGRTSPTAPPTAASRSSRVCRSLTRAPPPRACKSTTMALAVAETTRIRWVLALCPRP